MTTFEWSLEWPSYTGLTVPSTRKEIFTQVFESFI